MLVLSFSLPQHVLVRLSQGEAAAKNTVSKHGMRLGRAFGVLAVLFL